MGNKEKFAISLITIGLLVTPYIITMNEDSYLYIAHSNKKIYSPEIYEILSVYNPGLIIMLDNWKYPVNISSLREYLSHNNIDKEQYVSETHDCDNYAFELYGDIAKDNGDLAFGIIILYNFYSHDEHAMNIVIGEHYVYAVEPQSDAIIPLSWMIQDGWHIDMVIMWSASSVE